MSLLQISSIPHNAIAPPQKIPWLSSTTGNALLSPIFNNTHIIENQIISTIIQKKFIFRVTFSLFLHLTYIENIRDIMRKTKRSETAFSSTCVAEEKANME